MKKNILIIELLLTIFIISLNFSCANRNINERVYNNIESDLSNKDYRGTVNSIEKSKKRYGKNNKLLYFMDLGWAYHLAGDSIEAQYNFKQADDQIADLFTRNIFNDVRFRGEDFEKVALTIFRALDYAFNNKFSDATVEVRKVNDRLKFLNSERKEKAVYTEDAFARYLAGILYESQKEYNDAYLSYLKAYQAYKTYSSVYRVNIPEELKKSLKTYMYDYASKKNIIPLKKELEYVTPNKNKKQGRFIFTHYNGYAPKKVKKIFRIIPSRYNRRDIKRDLFMSYADFQVRNHEITYAKVFVNGTEYKTDLVQPIDRIAIRNLKDRLKRYWRVLISNRINEFLNFRRIAIRNLEIDAENMIRNHIRNALNRACLIVNGRIDCSNASNTIRKTCLVVNGVRDCEGDTEYKYQEKINQKNDQEIDQENNQNKTENVYQESCMLITERVYCEDQEEKVGAKNCTHLKIDCTQENKFNNKLREVNCRYQNQNQYLSCTGGNISNPRNLIQDLENKLNKEARRVKSVDLRSWRLIPASINLANIRLNPGFYKIDVEFYNSSNRVVETTSFDNVKIEQNKEVFKWYRTVK